MAHDATKVVLGSTQSSDRTVDSYTGTIPAGKVVRLKSDSTLSIAKTDGSLLGISLGKDLSDSSQVAVCRKGIDVPILLTASFTPVIGAQVSVDDLTGIAKAAGTGVTAVNAVYKSAVLTGINEDDTESNVALIDMQGGL